ncbi:MAG TPA: hypothetical protein VFQ39_02615 [Longimicrobium sp.]|nr:hypothetical protein [Longimicrobium sp.]
MDRTWLAILRRALAIAAALLAPAAAAGQKVLPDRAPALAQAELPERVPLRMEFAPLPSNWASWYFAEMDLAARAAGLPPLRETPMAPGEREVRVWFVGGLGYPRRFYRIRGEGAGANGSLMEFWKRDHDASRPDSTRYEALIRHYQKGRCGEIGVFRSIEACEVRTDTPPDWAAVLASAEAAGLRTLPDEDDLPEDGNGFRITIDGWTLVVEVREGASYRAYHYDCPNASSDTDEIRRAGAVAEAFRAVLANARRPDVEIVYRGRWDRRGSTVSEFQPCGVRETWELTGLLGDVPSLAPDERTRTYVEVRAVLAPVWLSRQWKSRYLRVLQVREVLARRDWDRALCDAPPAAGG